MPLRSFLASCANLRGPGNTADAAARVRTPTVLQMEAVECGAAALGIVLGFHEKYVPLEELRIACGVSRDGAKASSVVKAARTYGLTARGARLEIADLRKQKLPAILFWNFNHFVVLEGFGKRGVYLNDPAGGPRQVTYEAFEKAFTGVTLLFDRGPDFVPSGRMPGILKALVVRLSHVKSALWFVMLASLALVVPGVLVPVFSKVFVDNYLIGRMNGWIKPLLIGMAGTAAVRGVLTWLQQKYLLRLETHLSVTGSSTFFWHILRLPLEFFSQRHAGDISQRVEANDRVAQLLSGELATNAVNTVMLVFYLAVMLTYDWSLTLVGVALTALNLIALKAIDRLRTDGNMLLLQDRGKLMAATIGGIQTIETIKASGAENDFFARWTGYRAKVNNTEQRLEFHTRLLSALPGLLNALIGVAVLGLGGAQVIAGAMSIGTLVAFQSLMTSLTTPVSKLMTLAGKYQEAKGDMARLSDVMRYPMDRDFAEPTQATPATDTTATAHAKLRGHLELRNISFGYSRLEPALIEDFNLSLAPGRRVALVGGSGSGKSTVARIVLGLNHPWSGEVLFDGVPRHQVPRPVLVGSLAGVEQEPYLFEGSVRDNLTLWDSTLPQADMIQAARDALIHDAIVGRPDGYDSGVGEAGAGFSGGQIQRLDIARALAAGPRILVLDEATSALDPLTEMTIDANIRARGCACLIIAHRLSTVRDADEIIVMEHGRIVERGTHEALLAGNGAYSKLIRSA
ncbi:NHLP family bacteriocin export ABC transporter peptidase/permease/ATPase subunit [Trinickia dinghuensis]|uniref:Cyclolysin secretion/processing ATP-binding protein CyaB n=1 Tax=Trinickia dinghuensis TaxID=2291023 RepID=A0A3D8JRS7_9BURK|nr:NHLP family bacteriocin export ABC transporter peptidase/permease/ATPase subunit [Trinickia dinghuensis]RDU95492.1 NHLP family bacteriocin export ABC transporter peptidase/permease/ATPase subunit [Trinickia dinghuensis]